MKWNLKTTYFELPEIFFSRLRPTPVAKPSLAVFNSPLAKELGLGDWDEHADLSILAGNQLANGSEPLAQAYAGHQYAHFTRLGDGRALLLGEHATPDGRRFDIQLKGSGPTPYSRRGDGRAALGPMLREYVISEAMAALGIPTTRSLAVVLTGEDVYRETVQPGAILTRVAASHIRVGTFEFAAEFSDREGLKALADYTMKRHYPEIPAGDYREFLGAVCERQGQLLAQWMSVGFIHGVMNTDNMALSGETIDYGPCAFMDVYDPATVFSSIDHQGRYAYGRQPNIALWNLARFAETLLPLLDVKESDLFEIEKILVRFQSTFDREWRALLHSKLGWTDGDHVDLIERLFAWMLKTKADFNGTFRALGRAATTPFSDQEFAQWHRDWRERVTAQRPWDVIREQLNQTNPAVIPRNHAVDQALRAAEGGDLVPFLKLVEAVRAPFVERPEDEALHRGPKPGEQVEQTFCGT